MTTPTTFDDLGLTPAQMGKFLHAVADRVGPNETVGDKLSEADLQAILAEVLNTESA